ncbi:DUF6282 family protein [Agrococcus sp. ARC_14]|uniref:DUF6282 family protein n=1 Tax=Agrococcus sp. ARC_14 TaxID=2919927 RepID=UPI001F06FC6F|nr:DUF6282 family protein [Agrococcus sp. ARC_14]
MSTHPPIAEVLDGAVDLHCHSGPNPFAREFDHVEAARDAQRLNMRGILVKSHHHNTVMDLLAMRRELADITTPVFGGVAMNAQIGGINPYAVAMSLRMGGRAVWFPTFSSRQHVENEHHGFPESDIEIPNRIVDVVDDAGELLPEVFEVIELVQESDAMLSVGHLEPRESLRVATEARARGVRRMVMSHPDFVVDAAPELCESMADLGVYIEHEIGMYDPEGYRKWDPDALVEWIRRIGPDRTVLSSDLGQRGRPMPVDAFQRVGLELLARGISVPELQQLMCHNAAFVLGLDAARPAPVAS